MAVRSRRDSSALVFIEGDAVVAEDAAGSVIRSGKAGTDDATVVQSAVDNSHPAGEVKMSRGAYAFDKPVIIANSGTISGEGRGTVISPPRGDFAFKVMTTEKTETYRPFQPGGRLYAVIVRDLAIDGEINDGDWTGKGIYLNSFWSSTFHNLWIEKTSTALYMHRVHESSFSNIYLIANGNASAKEASVVMAAQSDNVHIRGLHLIYPNYIGLEMTGSATDSRDAPRLIFISDSMFHGWLPSGKVWGKAPWPEAAPYDLIHLRDCDSQKDGRTDVVIANSRITVAGRDHASVNVINSVVTIRNSVITATGGKYVVRASQGARVRLTGNSFHGNNPAGSKYAVHAADAEVLFKDNIVTGKNLQIYLAPGRNSIIADNRFSVEADTPAIWVGDDGATGSSNVQIRGNIFCGKDQTAAVEVSSLSTENIDVSGNQFVGK